MSTKEKLYDLDYLKLGIDQDVIEEYTNAILLWNSVVAAFIRNCHHVLEDDLSNTKKEIKYLPELEKAFKNYVSFKEVINYYEQKYPEILLIRKKIEKKDNENSLADDIENYTIIQKVLEQINTKEDGQISLEDYNRRKSLLILSEHLKQKYGIDSEEVSVKGLSNYISDENQPD